MAKTEHTFDDFSNGAWDAMVEGYDYNTFASLSEQALDYGAEHKYNLEELLIEFGERPTRALMEYKQIPVSDLANRKKLFRSMSIGEKLVVLAELSIQARHDLNLDQDN